MPHQRPREPTDPHGQRPARDRTDPRGQRATYAGPSRLLPALPTLLIASAAVVLAFVLGRATGGGGGEERSVSAATVGTTTTTVPRPTMHTVARGESLLGIASKYSVTADALAAANGITNQNHVFVGQVLTIPPTTLNPALTTTTTTTRPKKK
ncbi:MAG TPA: LysM domain-containing protein [Acidimicrobiia bacterium]